jgi:hypothetical protein
LRHWIDKQLDDRDVVAEEIIRLGKSFPTLVKTLITERDMYMVARLRECAAVLQPSCIVAVVGAGHLTGMVDLWEQPFDAGQLDALSKSAVGNEVYSAAPTVVTDDMLAYLNTDDRSAVPETAMDAAGPRAELRFAVGAKVLVRDASGLFLRGQVVAHRFTFNPEALVASADATEFPSTVAYLVFTEQGEYVAAPIDSEACISLDLFTMKPRRWPPRPHVMPHPSPLLTFPAESGIALGPSSILLPSEDIQVDERASSENLSPTDT